LAELQKELTHCGFASQHELSIFQFSYSSRILSLWVLEYALAGKQVAHFVAISFEFPSSIIII
jgi:hypothetical protein